jgi:hypothetical protein
MMRISRSSCGEEPMANEELKLWKCKNGHNLGVVSRGAEGTRLMLYRHAVDDESKRPEQVDVMAIIESGIDIRCDICGETRTWAPSQEAYERIMAYYEGRAEMGVASAGKAPASQ